jgi:phage baseplate assembly protein W
MPRRDYAFPFRIDAASHQAAQTPYAAHVDQMIRQVLLTSPGERADLPEFGCGVRRLVFAPNSQALDATAKLVVQQSLDKWLGTQIAVQSVDVTTPEGADTTIQITIAYTLVETQTAQSLQLVIGP